MVTVNDDEIIPRSVDHATSIRHNERSESSGIRFVKNPTSDKAEIFVVDETITQVVIYDALGNVVFSATETCLTSPNCTVIWNLQNTGGRYVATGTYLVVVETRDRNGRAQRHSARLGIRR